MLFSFGSDQPAPTLMGNIANTIQSYADQRYRLNFEIFWSRMHRAIQKGKEFAPMTQQAKTQLDFLISCCALTCVWSVIWTTLTAMTGARWPPFLVAAIAGPVIAYVWYRVAVIYYQTFADVLRTSVDVFRFDLLKDLHFALPDDVPEERELWDMLHRLHSFYEPHGLRYVHPKSP